ncbi:M48 family metallopeptidase [Myxococcota bacterium]|nr:M48 family metallopeptidase [Myxococcota bacterium]
MSWPLWVSLLACSGPPSDEAAEGVAAPPAPNRRGVQTPPLPERCLYGLDPQLAQRLMELDTLSRATLMGGGWDGAREAKLGQSLLVTLKGRVNLRQDPRVDTLLTRLNLGGVPLRFEHTAWVLDEANPNAYALPGGRIVLSAGLLALTEGDDDALAFALAHELAHVELYHSAAVYQRLWATQGWADPAWGPLLALTRHATSATQELEADRLGAALAQRAGFSLDAAEALLERLPPAASADLSDLFGADLQALPPELRALVLDGLGTHPNVEARRCAVRDGATLPL